MPKKIPTNFFHFTRKERSGIVVLLFFILLLCVIPFFYPFIFKDEIIDPGSVKNELASLKIKQADSSNKNYKRDFDDGAYRNYYQPQENVHTKIKHEGELFNFDPNTTSAADWKRLGLRDKTINTIMNFINKGGKFRHAEDIKKIWGLHEDEIQRLLPYVHIVSTVASVNTQAVYETKHFENKKIFTPVDINAADSTAFDDLPGIGGKLSVRIINFREKLGGFYSIEQVAETFGLPDSTFQKIKARLVMNNNILRKININTASLEEMKIHPYIRYNIANAIVQYRKQHGNFLNVEDIKKIGLINDELFNKLSPYLLVQ